MPRPENENTKSAQALSLEKICVSYLSGDGTWYVETKHVELLYKLRRRISGSTISMLQTLGCIIFGKVVKSLALPWILGENPF